MVQESSRIEALEATSSHLYARVDSLEATNLRLQKKLKEKDEKVAHLEKKLENWNKLPSSKRKHLLTTAQKSMIARPMDLLYRCLKPRTGVLAITMVRKGLLENRAILDRLLHQLEMRVNHLRRYPRLFQEQSPT